MAVATDPEATKLAPKPLSRPAAAGAGRAVRALAPWLHPPTPFEAPRSGERDPVADVGPIAALSFMTAVDDPSYFEPSRDVAGYWWPISSRQSQGGYPTGAFAPGRCLQHIRCPHKHGFELDA
jgi:hypothetical protein